MATLLELHADAASPRRSMVHAPRGFSTSLLCVQSPVRSMSRKWFVRESLRAGIKPRGCMTAGALAPRVRAPYHIARQSSYNMSRFTWDFADAGEMAPEMVGGWCSPCSLQIVQPGDSLPEKGASYAMTAQTLWASAASSAHKQKRTPLSRNPFKSQLAESWGFEPQKGLLVPYSLSRRAPSASRSALRVLWDHTSKGPRCTTDNLKELTSAT